MRKIALLGAATLLILHLLPRLLDAGTLDLGYSTYLGGSGDDWAFGGIARGTGGEVFITGNTDSADFPTADPLQAGRNGSTDVYLAKLSSAGSSLVYSTYLGGAGTDAVTGGIAPGPDGEAFVGGITNSADFPTVNPYQASCAGDHDAFVIRLSSSGSSLVYSTYLGGSGEDRNLGMALGTGGEAYAAGYTASTDLPTINPYQAFHGGGLYDAFVCKLSTSGSLLLYSTYLGGSNSDQAWGGVALGTTGIAYTAGYTQSSDFPTANPYQASSGGTYDIFVSAVSPSGSILVYSTFFGGGAVDIARGIIAGDGGEVYAAGYTISTDLPTANPYQSSHGGGSYDALAFGLSSSGSALLFSTYLGGNGNDGGHQISRDTTGEASLTGYTVSSDFPTLNPYQATGSGGSDAFLARLSSSGSALIYSTYFGGNSSEEAYGIATGTGAETYITGFTLSTDFPTRNPYQASKRENIDAFVSKFAYLATPTPAKSSSPTPTPTSAPSATPPPTATPSPEPSATPSAKPSATATPSPVPSPSPSPTPTCGPTIPPQKAVIADGDYNGDGTAEYAVFRPATGMWSIRGYTAAYLGTAGDRAEPGDYDGDGSADIAVFSPSSGLWSVRGLTRLFYGTAGDIPAPGDYDGDGADDIALFRSSIGRWHIRDHTRIIFGADGDWPAPADFDGSGTARLAVYRPGEGLWAVRGLSRFIFGGPDDWPVPLDHTGHGILSAAVWRPCNGMWAIRDFTRQYYGVCTDWPRPADYDGDGVDDPGVFRDWRGMWAVRMLTRIYLGEMDDIPATR